MPIKRRLTGNNVSKPTAIVAVVSQEDAADAGIVFDDLTSLKPKARFRAALAAIPVGQTMKTKEFNEKWAFPYLKQKYKIYGIDLAVYPVDRRVMLDDRHTLCITAQVSVLTRHPKTGKMHVIKLNPEYQIAWYMTVVQWLVEHEFITL